jgi:hypothetical protein
VLYDPSSGAPIPAPGVTVTFSSAPSIAIPPAITNAAGVATTTFGMPDLSMGAVVIAATVGTVSDTLTLVQQ